MNLSQTYTIKDSTLTLRIGDIASAKADVVVSSDDSALTMRGGTSKAILQAAGESVFLSTRNLIPLETGAVRASTSGELGARGVKYIFHAVTRQVGQRQAEGGEELIAAQATSRCLELLSSMGLRSIAFPALGTGFSGFNPTNAAIAMAQEIVRFLQDRAVAVEVEIWLLFGAGRDMEALEFFGEFTGRLQLGAAASKSHAVVLIHGIRTRAGWSGRVREEIRGAAPSLTPILVGYGFFDVLRFFLPFGPWRKRAAETVWQKVGPLFSNPNFDKVSIVAHSFGTWITSYLLVHKDIQVYRVVLCGAIVDENFDWYSVESKIVGPAFPGEPSRKVLNEIGVRDIWPLMAQCATWGYGNSGRCGFNMPLVEDRYHVVDHSGFFSPSFAARYWVPALRDERIAAGEVEKTDPGYFWNLLSVVKVPVIALVALISFAVLG